MSHLSCAPVKRARRIACVLLLVGAVLCAVRPAPSQVRLIAPAQGPPDLEPRLGDPQQGVYVRDSAIAADKLELAKRMERLREWNKSADVYQEILEKHHDRVIATHTDDRGQVTRYVSVAVAVQERLARWPEEGLAVYNSRFGPSAQVLLVQAGQDDRAILHRVFDTYFPTDSARDAGIRLIDLYLESGDFAAAAWLGHRLLAWHPNLSDLRPQVIFRTALAHHLGGSASEAARLLATLTSDHPDATGIVAGSERRLVDSLRLILQRPSPVAAATASESWRTYGGDASRSLISGATASPSACLYRVPLGGGPSGGATEVGRTTAALQSSTTRLGGLGITIMPVVDRGQLFFQDGQRVFALHLESGVPLAGWQQTYPHQSGQYWLPGQGTNAMEGAALLGVPWQHTLTLTDDAVLGVMGRGGPLAIPGIGQGGDVQSSSRLVCLDRATGRQRWSIVPNLPEGSARALVFSGSPVVVDDNVYIIVRGTSSAGVEDCHVASYSLADGTLRWATYLASSQTSGAFMPGSATLSHLAFSSGRLLVCTNLGAVAAVDAYNGGIIWLSIYPRDVQLAFRGRFVPGAAGFGGFISSTPTEDTPRPWELNPVIVRDGRVFVLPGDGDHLLVYDGGSGEELHRIPKVVPATVPGSGGRAERITALLGVVGPQLVVAGRRAIYWIDWAEYPAPSPGAAAVTRRQIKPSSFDGILGRPFVTASHVFVPTERAIAVVESEPARVVLRYPRDSAAWPEDEGPGNIVVSQDYVVVAGDSSVAVYTNIDGVRQKYQLALAADPNAVEPRLLFAEQMFNAREFDEAIACLDEAIELLGGRGAMRPGPNRDRVFADALMFAVKLTAEATAHLQAMAEGLFDRAASAAASPSQQVNYRLTRARSLESSPGTAPRAVELYQQVLADATLRGVMLGGEGGRRAGVVAEQAIAQLIRRHGPGAYAALERKAAEAFRQIPASDPQRLLELAEAYPNSSVALQAMIRAADAFEQTAQPAAALRVLRQLSWKHGTRLDSAYARRLHETLARNYLRAGNIEAAWRRTERAQLADPTMKLGGPLLLPDAQLLRSADGGPVETMAQAATALAQLYERSMEAALPDVRMPPPPGATPAGQKPTPPFVLDRQATIANVQAIVTPPPYAGSDRADRTDRVVIWSMGSLMCLVPGSTQPLWSSQALSTLPQGLLWCGQNMAAWDLTRLVLFDGDDGRVLWTMTIDALPPAELLVGPAALPAPEAGGIVAGEGVRVFVGPNVIRPRPMPLPQPGAPDDGRERISHVLPLSDRLMVATTASRIAALDLGDGRIIWQARLAQGNGIQQVLATDDFTVVRLVVGASIELAAFDSADGQPVFRRSFAATQGTWPLNCALSADGILIWTTAQSIAAKDLFQGGDQLLWEQAGRGYTTNPRHDRILVVGQQVLAAAGRTVERRDVRTGRPLAEGLNLSEADVTLRLAGTRLYALGARSVLASPLGFKGWFWPQFAEEDVTYLPEAAMVTRDYLLLPYARSRGGMGAVQVRAFSRAIVRSGEARSESGLLSYEFDLGEPIRVRGWRAADGGVYYLTFDGRLNWLKGRGGMQQAAG